MASHGNNPGSTAANPIIIDDHVHIIRDIDNDVQILREVFIIPDDNLRSTNHAGVVLGTFKFSPQNHPDKHVVIGTFDDNGRFHRRVRGYTITGLNNPIGNLGGLTAVSHNAVDYIPPFDTMSEDGIRTWVWTRERRPGQPPPLSQPRIPRP